MNLKTSCPIILVYCKSKPYEIKNKLPYINRKRTIGFLFLSPQVFAITGNLKRPLMFRTEKATYSVQNHAVLMSEGSFGGFIVGFLTQELPWPLWQSGGINR